MISLLLDPFAGYSIGIELVAIMISVAGMILGVGYALDDKKIKDFGHAELYQALINGAIIGAVFIGFSQYGIFTSVINGLTGSVSQLACNGAMGYNYAICFAYNYLTSATPIVVLGQQYPSVLTSTMGLLAAVAGLYMVLATVASAGINLVISINLQGLGVFLGPLREVIDLLSISAFAVMAQADILKFAASATITALLPVGLVLRTFYFTRRLGGTIVAIAISLFAIFPLTYVMGAQVLGASSLVLQNSAASDISGASSALKSIADSALSPFQNLNLTEGWSIPMNLALDALASFTATMTSIMEEIASTLAFTVLQAFFLPAFSVILTVVSARELARLLGTEISFGRFDVF